ncbi:MAG: helix-turn-helix domain-containing protein, partial [Oscillospiraceae bacterium]|nr:helix-turn-helix domain-containing protein [Oscillospiraceae bacterium]
MDNIKIAGFIADKRKEKQLTQQQLADQLHVTHKAVSKWETAKGLPDIATVPRLCEALDISPAEFFMGEAIPQSQNITSDKLVISVAQKYQEMGKKRMICFSTFLICMFVLVAVSFFGDGGGKIIMLITAYIVSAISVYKLAAVSVSDIPRLQKICGICFVVLTIVSIALGANYFTAKNTGDITVTNHIAYLVFGDYSYTLQKFL